MGPQITFPYFFDAVVATGGTLPLIAPRTMIPDAFKVGADFVLGLRPAPPAEIHMMLHYAMNAEALRCVRFVVFARSDTDDLDDIIAALTQATKTVGIETPVIHYVDSSAGLDAAQAMNLWYGDGTNVAGCAITYLSRLEVAALALQLHSDTRFMNGAIPYAILVPNLDSKVTYLNSTANGTEDAAAFDAIKVVQFLQDPLDSSNPTTAVFQDDLQNWFATDGGARTNLFPTNYFTMPIYALPTAPSYFSYEGYMAGMLAAQLVLRTPELTKPSDLITTAFGLRYLYVGDTVFGPYVRSCAPRAVSPLPCFCNSGSRLLAMSSGSGGIIRPVADEALPEIA